MSFLFTHQTRTQILLFGLLAICSGCTLTHSHKTTQVPALRPASTPRELCKASMPRYVIEPPDILKIEVVRTVPKKTYRLNTTDLVRIRVSRNSLDRLVAGDVVSIRVPAAPPTSPIDGNFIVQSDGTISLGNPYGSIHVSGMTLEEMREKLESSLSQILVASESYVSLVEAGVPIDGEFSIEIDGTIDFGQVYGRATLDGLTILEAREALTEFFKGKIDDPSVSLNLIQSSTLQQVIGEHMVGPDGYVSLGIYGSVKVVGMTQEEASAAIESTLSSALDEPKVATSILSYNSKLFYIITQGAGIGDAVYRFPVTGNDTVLDAISLIQGVPQGSSNEMWIARPSENEHHFQILPVEWEQLTSLAATDTNYQLLPGDRLYIRRDPFISFDNKLAKFINPFERILGFSILGAETATRLSGKVLQGGGNPRGRF